MILLPKQKLECFLTNKLTVPVAFDVVSEIVQRGSDIHKSHAAKKARSYTIND